MNIKLKSSTTKIINYLNSDGFITNLMKHKINETFYVSGGKLGLVSHRRVEFEPGQTQEGRANFSVSP